MGCREWKIAGALLLALVCAPAAAQTPPAYPTRLVRIIVNSQAGGTVDIVGRMLADELQKTWSQSVIVENIVGAAGNAGAGTFARAEPDGHTLLLSHPGPLTVNPLMFRSMPYDPEKLVPITNPLSLANVLNVSTQLGVKNLQELIDYARKNPGRLTYGSQGIGTTPHLTGSLLSTRIGVEMVHVPYRGSPAAILDLSAGRLDMMFDNIGTAAPPHEAGQTRIIAVADDKRLPRLPDVPTMAEAGLPNFRSITWFGLMAPEGTPPALIAKINADVVKIVRQPEFTARLQAMHLEPIANSPAEAKKFIVEETALWGKVIKDAGIKPE